MATQNTTTVNASSTSNTKTVSASGNNSGSGQGLSRLQSRTTSVGRRTGYSSSNKGASEQAKRDAAKRASDRSRQSVTQTPNNLSSGAEQNVSLEATKTPIQQGFTPQPVASAQEGGVIFSDGFRGTPVASTNQGTIYIKNQSVPSSYGRSNSGSSNGVRSGSGSSVSPSPQSFTGKVEPAKQTSFFKAPLAYTEQKVDYYQYQADKAKQGSFKQFSSSAAAFGLGVVAGTGRFGESVLRLADPGEKNTIKQGIRSVGAGISEIKQTGGLYSVGDYIRANPSKAAADIAVGVGTARFELPKFKNYPKVGVVGDTLEEVRVTRAPASFEKPSKLTTESAASRALKSGAVSDTEAFISNLNKEVYRKVDVTSPSSLDNILPSTKPSSTIEVTTSRSVSVRRAGGSRSVNVKASQSVPKDFLKPPAEPNMNIVIDKSGSIVPQSTLFKQAARKLERGPGYAEADRLRFFKTNRYPEGTSAFKDFFDYAERPPVIDLNKAISKKYELYIDSSGVENIRRTSASKAAASEARRIDFNKRMSEVFNNKKGSFFPSGKKGSAQLLPPEVIEKKSPSSVLREAYGTPKRLSRSRSIPEFEPPVVPRSRVSGDFIPVISDGVVESYSFRIPRISSVSVAGNYLGVSPSVKQSSRSSSLPIQEFRVFQDTGKNVSQAIGSSSSQSVGSSQARSSTRSSSRFTFATNIPPIGSSLVSKEPKSGFDKFVTFPSGGGVGGVYRESRRTSSGRKKYTASLTGIELGLKGSRGLKRLGRSGRGVSGLEVRGI